MNPQRTSHPAPSEVRYAWPPQGSDMSSRMAVTVCLDVLRWATVTGRMQLPYGDSLR